MTLAVGQACPRCLLEGRLAGLMQAAFRCTFNIEAKRVIAQ